MIEPRLERASESDFERLFAIRMDAMRGSLERIGRFDMERGRRRFRETFRPEYTWLILSTDGELLGCVALGPRDGGLWLEHFYLRPEATGQGIGAAVMRRLLSNSDSNNETIRLDVVRDSAAKAFYQRFGFVETHRDEIDIFMIRQPSTLAPVEASLLA